MSNTATQAVGAILTYIAVGFIIAAQVSRYWIVSELSITGSTTITRIEYGLYEACQTASGISTCFLYSWTPQFSGEELTAFVTRVILIGADPFLLGGFIASFIAWALSEKNQRKCLIAAGSMNIIGGTLTVLAAITYIALALSQFLLSNLTNTLITRTYDFSWCYGFCWAAGVLFIVGGVMQIIAAQKPRSNVVPSEPTVWTTTQYTTTPAPQNYQGYRPPANNNYPSQGYY